MSLPEGVVILNRMMEDFAVKQDFATLEKLAFIKQQIIKHTCRQKKKWVGRN